MIGQFETAERGKTKIVSGHKSHMKKGGKKGGRKRHGRK